MEKQRARARVQATPIVNCVVPVKNNNAKVNTFTPEQQTMLHESTLDFLNNCGNSWIDWYDNDKLDCVDWNAVAEDHWTGFTDDMVYYMMMVIYKYCETESNKRLERHKNEPPPIFTGQLSVSSSAPIINKVVPSSIVHPDTIPLPKTLKLVVKEPLISKYDPKEQYYWHDYVRKFNDKKISIDVDYPKHSIPDEILEDLTREMSKCARVLIGAKNKLCCIFKETDLTLFRQEDFHPFSQPMKYTFTLVQNYIKNDEAAKDERKFSIYAPLYLQQHLWVNQLVFEPYHSDIGYNRDNVLNTFPGFGAKLVPWSIDKYRLIEPILSHIFVVWANSNVEYYKYVLRWMSYPITHLTKAGKVLILKGKQGCGKTFIFEFLRDFVYSNNAATIVKSIQDVLCRFNGILTGKLLVMVDESASVKDGSMTKKEKNDFKALLTGNTIHIENKGKDIIELDNRLTFAIGTNNDNCADLDEGSRREFILDCNPIYCGNRPYFDSLCKTFNQDTGDAFYTYLRLISEIHGGDYLPHIEAVPSTDIKTNMIEMSKSKANVFMDSIFDGSTPIPRHLIYRDDALVGLYNTDISLPAFNNKQFHYYIITKDLYSEVYKPWHREFSTGVPWSERSFSDNLFRYDPTNIVRARKRTAKINGSIAYISEKYYDTISILTEVNTLGTGGDMVALRNI